MTDFGSAKIIGRETETEEGHKRSFVGSADFVSPEVLRNEPAVFASDIWAFGCILYQLLVGKPPFRGATDYLTFQKILKRDFEYPEGFDPEAKALIEIVLVRRGFSGRLTRRTLTPPVGRPLQRSSSMRFSLLSISGHCGRSRLPPCRPVSTPLSRPWPTLRPMPTFGQCSTMKCQTEGSSLTTRRWAPRRRAADLGTTDTPRRKQCKRSTGRRGVWSFRDRRLSRGVRKRGETGRSGRKARGPRRARATIGRL